MAVLVYVLDAFVTYGNKGIIHPTRVDSVAISAPFFAESPFSIFRFLKNYNLNFHLNPDSDKIIPGNTISMSSYSGKELPTIAWVVAHVRFCNRHFLWKFPKLFFLF